ncbi:MAG: hypothetical protein N4R51_02120 [Lactobacillus crispatus]|nr:hypothetical protein [Lactobacillus crispatus]
MTRLSKTVLAGSAILAGSGIVASSNGLTIVAHASQKSDNQSTSTNTDTTSSNDDASVEEKLKKLSNQGKPFVSKTALANRHGRVRVVVPVVKQKTITSKLSNGSDSSVQGESSDVQKESTNNVIISTSSPNLVNQANPKNKGRFYDAKDNWQNHPETLKDHPDIQAKISNIQYTDAQLDQSVARMRKKYGDKAIDEVLNFYANSNPTDKAKGLKLGKEIVAAYDEDQPYFTQNDPHGIYQKARALSKEAGAFDFQSVIKQAERKQKVSKGDPQDYAHYVKLDIIDDTTGKVLKSYENLLARSAPLTFNDGYTTQSIDDLEDGNFLTPDLWNGTDKVLEQVAEYEKQGYKIVSNDYEPFFNEDYAKKHPDMSYSTVQLTSKGLAKAKDSMKLEQIFETGGQAFIPVSWLKDNANGQSLKELLDSNSKQISPIIQNARLTGTTIYNQISGQDYNPVLVSADYLAIHLTRNTDKPTTPSEPATPDKPATPNKSATPDKPTTPSKPATPDKPATPSKPATPDKPATPSKPATSDKPATPNKSATADKLVSSSKSSTADKPVLANRPTVKDESAKSTTTAPLSTSTSSNSNKSVDPVLSKKENVSASTKSKSKTTEPTTDSVNGKHSEVKSADYNSSLPQTNNKSSLAGVLAGSAMIATMSTLGIAYKKKQN